MDTEWIDIAALAHKGAEKDFKAEWDAYRFMLEDKMFAMLGTEKNGRPILTVKLEPEHGELLRKENPNVIPGYYMNKVHWNSIYLDSDVPQETIVPLIAESYLLILKSLPKTKQAQIAAQE